MHFAGKDEPRNPQFFTLQVMALKQAVLIAVRRYLMNGDSPFLTVLCSSLS